MNDFFSPNKPALVGAAIFLTTLAALPLRAAFVYETEQEFITTGDFNGDGKPDIAIVDKAKGRVRFGYQLA